MPKLPRITARRFARALHGAGFALIRQTGSHAFFRHADGRFVNVPMHGGDLKTPTLAAILKAAGLTGAELRDLL
jgi:predicted RNA binding protein YcfA (HicA-like mRNA interferase family)